MADLCNAPDPVALARHAAGERVGSLKDHVGDLLAPIDLQAIKAAGVTFAVSLLERLIEEHAKGDPARAEQVRKELNQIIGADVSTIKPGSPEAEALKKTLMARGAWSPYLEVGIGPYAEIFTKAPAMAAVGYGAEIGIRSDSDWNNPEPEVTLVVNARGHIVGATLGNDVNLRDIEGRSALLLGKAKDNNASCAIGPFIRLFDYDLHARRCAQGQGRARGDGSRPVPPARRQRPVEDQPRSDRARAPMRWVTRTSIPTAWC